MPYIKSEGLFSQPDRFLKIGLRTTERRIGTCRFVRIGRLQPLLLPFPHIFHPAEETLETPRIGPYASFVQTHLSFLKQDRLIIRQKLPQAVERSIKVPVSGVPFCFGPQGITEV